MLRYPDNWPRNARWQLVDPRWTMGLFGGDGPPFGGLRAQFRRKQLTPFRISSSGSGSITKLGKKAFFATYRIGRHSGQINASVEDDGNLELTFYGSVELECEAVLRSVDADSKLAILTCISNGTAAWSPGHSALVVDDAVYTFEEVSYFSSRGGWLVLPTRSYLAKDTNKKRPIVIQELRQDKVDAGEVIRYLVRSISRDDDYGGSGVCSSQVASAIEAGYSGSFNSWGIDTPHDVYELAVDKKIVSKTYLIWDRGRTPAGDVAALDQKLVDDYASPAPSSGTDCRKWSY